MNKILVAFGTRPEYIKVRSIIENLDNCKTLFTGQHTDLLKNIKVDFKIDMSNKSNNRLNDIFTSILSIDLKSFGNPDYVLVQGDTSSAAAIALSAFHHKIKVIHLEAGLRTFDVNNPYPEELNRQMISRIANIHLCPTQLNKENLLKEGINKNIFITGNTGLDNINRTGCEYTNVVLITLHRRDNLPIMNKWFEELSKLAKTHQELTFIIPLHPNPNVQKYKHLLDGIKIIDPINHDKMIELVKKSKFIISDSGGLQEEASFLNKRIIVCRKSTERPEVLKAVRKSLKANCFGILCKNPDDLKNIFKKVNENYEIQGECPFGDGKSWIKIKKIIKTFQ